MNKVDAVNDSIPIFIKISEGIKDHILSGDFKEGDKLPSTTWISNEYDINIATVNKGVNVLVSEGIVFKKRGIGMFIAEGAVDKLIEERRKTYKEKYIVSALEEAKRLRYTIEELQAMVQEVYSPDEE